MLENGYGEHNIQGIGDKHIPLIHNVMNTDVVCAVSDRATDELDVLWNTDTGRQYLERRGVPAGVIGGLAHFGLSSTCNVLAAIKAAKLLGLGPEDAIITVATDGGAMYPSERAKQLATRYRGEFSHTDAAAAYAQHVTGASTDHIIELTEADRRRIFNLGYYTWVEQQGTPFELFEQRRHQAFWQGLRRYVGLWDEMITDFNDRVVAGGGAP
jgi:cysteine synthase A